LQAADALPMQCLIDGKVRFAVNDVIRANLATGCIFTFSPDRPSNAGWEYFFPIVLAGYGPVVDGCRVERRVESTKHRRPIIGMFSHGISVMYY
jgi:hypothetical protein